jgi:hypothetical protein
MQGITLLHASFPVQNETTPVEVRFAGARRPLPAAGNRWLLPPVFCIPSIDFFCRDLNCRVHNGLAMFNHDPSTELLTYFFFVAPPVLSVFMLLLLCAMR